MWTRSIEQGIRQALLLAEFNTVACAERAWKNVYVGTNTIFLRTIWRGRFLSGVMAGGGSRPRSRFSRVLLAVKTDLTMLQKPPSVA